MSFDHFLTGVCLPSVELYEFFAAVLSLWPLSHHCTCSRVGGELSLSGCLLFSLFSMCLLQCSLDIFQISYTSICFSSWLLSTLAVNLVRAWKHMQPPATLQPSCISQEVNFLKGTFYYMVGRVFLFCFVFTNHLLSHLPPILPRETKDRYSAVFKLPHFLCLMSRN